MSYTLIARLPRPPREWRRSHPRGRYHTRFEHEARQRLLYATDLGLITPTEGDQLERLADTLNPLHQLNDRPHLVLSDTA